MTASISTQGPLPGAYPNLTLWVTPLWGTGTDITQEQFESCLFQSLGDQDPPILTAQIVNGSYGIPVLPNEVATVAAGLSISLTNCIEP